MQACCFCEESVGPGEGVDYGPGYFAHHRCYLAAGHPIKGLPKWQVERFPWRLLAEHGQLEQALDLTVGDGPTMTPTEFRAARDRFGLTEAGMARVLRLGAHGARTIRRYEAGEIEPSGPVTLAMELLLALDGKKAGTFLAIGRDRRRRPRTVQIVGSNSGAA